MIGPCRLLAFVRDASPASENFPLEGPILWSEGDFTEELKQTGAWDIADVMVPNTSERGLLVLEGWLEVDHGPDPDVHFDGDWRRLEHWEMCLLRFGKNPFERAEVEL